MLNIMLRLQNPFVLLFSALLIGFCIHCSFGTQFIVGDSAGWVIPPYPTYYSNWSRSQFMRVGDSLEFNFDIRFYNLIQVSKYEYEHCTSFEPLNVLNSSPTFFPLNESGVFFFICNISNYCCLGQKLAISVHECSSQNPPSLSPSPSPSPVPMISSAPLSPNGGNGTVIPVPNSSPGGNNNTNNGGNSSVPSSIDQGEKSKAFALKCGTSFSVSLGTLLFMFGTFLGSWVI